MPSTKCATCGSEIEGHICLKCGSQVSSEKESLEFKLPARKAFPVEMQEGGGVCRVCGITLDKDAKECEMCHSPLLDIEKEAVELLCPFCSKVIDDVEARCPHCGISFQEIEEKTSLSFQCPLCSEAVSIDSNSCGRCGVRIWLDLDEEMKKLDQYQCPFCFYAIKKEEIRCPKCGSEVWMEDEEELKERAERAIEDAEFQLSYSRKEGEGNWSKAEQILSSAERAFMEGNYRMAMNLAQLSEGTSKATSLQSKILQDVLIAGKERMEKAYELGGDTSQCNRLLELAQRAAKRGDYKVALRIAMKGKIFAERIQASRQRMGFELSDYK